jgi:hypothetical protein
VLRGHLQLHRVDPRVPIEGSLGKMAALRTLTFETPIMSTLPSKPRSSSGRLPFHTLRKTPGAERSHPDDGSQRQRRRSGNTASRP